MERLYPTIKKITALVVTVCLINATNAQHVAYASANTTTAKKVTPDESVVKIKARSENKVVIGWAPFKGAVSHYVVERSTNGRTFYEAGLLFTGDDWDNEPEYIYTDNLKVNYGGPLYYRLHVVGLDGSEIFTPVTIANGGSANLLTH